MDRDSAYPDVSSLSKSKEYSDRFAEHGALATHVYSFVLDKSEEGAGPFCKDLDGNVYLDFNCHVAANPLGYNNVLLEEKISDFEITSPTKIAGQDFYVKNGNHPGPVELMEKLTEYSGSKDTVFLSNSGAEAVENSMKICYDHNGGKRGICFQNAFHGRTLGTLSVNRSKAKYRRDFPEISGIESVPFCLRGRDTTGCESNCTCGFISGDGKTSIRRMIEKDYLDPNEVSYLILEPIQGEGGYNFPNDDFVEKVNGLRKDFDLSVICDEVQAGVGRTGEFWGSQRLDLDTDVIAAAKSLQVGATIANEEVFPDKESRLSSTWGAGDIISSMLGYYIIEVIEEENLMSHSVDKGKELAEKIRDKSVDGVDTVNQLGLMLGVDLEEPKSDEVMDVAFQKGLLLLSAGNKTIRLLPPLDVREREIDIGVDLLEESIEEVF